jgi:hypothetical protein
MAREALTMCMRDPHCKDLFDFDCIVKVAASLRRVPITTLGYGYGPLLAFRVERFVERRAG